MRCDQLLNFYAMCLIFEHIYTDVFAVLMEDFREARLARRNSKTVEKRYRQAGLQQFFAAALGHFTHEQVVRCKLFKIIPQARGNGSTVDGVGTGSHVESSSGTRGAAFWLWRHTAKRSKTRSLVVARARKRKDTHLLLSGWASLKKFAMLCHFKSCIAESQGSLRVLKSLKYSMQTSSCFSLFHMTKQVTANFHRCWIMLQACSHGLTTRWSRLVSAAKTFLFKKRKRYAETFRMYRLHSQEAAQMRCARVHLSIRQGFLLRCLALREWRHVAVLGHLAIFRCSASRLMRLLTQASGLEIGNSILGRQDMLGMVQSTSDMCTGRSVKLLWKRLGFAQWCAVIEDSRKEGRRRQILQQMHLKKIICSMLQHWESCNLEASSGDQRQRLLFSRWDLICTSIRHFIKQCTWEVRLGKLTPLDLAGFEIAIAITFACKHLT